MVAKAFHTSACFRPLNRSFLLGLLAGVGIALAAMNFSKRADAGLAEPAEPAATRGYENVLTPIANPKPLLADFPKFVEPVIESRRFEAPRLVDDPGADLEVRAWRFSYNARGIVEVPNRLRGDRTAVIVVHPWGIDDGQGWKTPEPAGVDRKSVV